MAEEMLLLVSMDEDEREVPRHIMEISELVSTMASNEDEEIPLCINTKFLDFAIDFCKHHAEEPCPSVPKPIDTADLSLLVPQYYSDLMTSIPFTERFEYIHAAEYLGIQPLISLGFASFACELKNKTIPEISEKFGFDKETKFTDEELKEVATDNPWMQGVTGKIAM